MCNNAVAKVVGIGDVCLEMSNDIKLVLRDVKHIPDFCVNLISVGKLDDDGYCSIFHNGQWKLTRDAMIVARAQKFSTLYMLQASLSKEIINVMDDESSVEL
jgi:hypothetical protein